MSRFNGRARRRAARYKKACDEFEAARRDPQAFEAVCRHLWASTLRLWKIAETVHKREPLTPDERALIAQIIDGKLAACTAGSVRKRLQIKA
jgi:hypothetical protein